jgi:alanine dehydrogenase
LQIANKGPEKAMLANKALLLGLNTYKGQITYKAVADSISAEYVPAETILSGL